MIATKFKRQYTTIRKVTICVCTFSTGASYICARREMTRLYVISLTIFSYNENAYCFEKCDSLTRRYVRFVRIIPPQCLKVAMLTRDATQRIKCLTYTNEEGLFQLLREVLGSHGPNSGRTVALLTAKLMKGKPNHFSTLATKEMEPQTLQSTN